MNKVLLIGRLTADPEIRSTQTGKKVAKFSVAVNEGKSKEGNDLVQYFNVSTWDRLAETAENYFKKGTKILVEGRLQNRSWDKPDGTKGYATDITMTSFEFLSPKSDTQSGESSNPQTEQSSPPASKSAAKKKKEDNNEEDQLPEIDIDAMNVQMPF